jgi:hypothetical protein
MLASGRFGSHPKSRPIAGKKPSKEAAAKKPAKQRKSA